MYSHDLSNKELLELYTQQVQQRAAELVLPISESEDYLRNVSPFLKEMDLMKTEILKRMGTKDTTVYTSLE